MTALQLVAASAAAALAVTVLALATLRARRQRDFTAPVIVVGVAGVASVALGVLLATATGAADGGDHGALLPALGAGLATGVVVALALARQVRRDAWALTTAARRLDEAAAATGTTPGALAQIAHELNATATRLGASRDRDRELEATRRELVTWVSHDLRAPLNGVRVIAEALRDGIAADPETLMDYVEALQLEVDALDRLVTDLFELSSVQSGSSPLKLEEASLTDAVSDTLAGMSALATARGVRLDGRLLEPVPTLPLATREFERALQNLVGNAIRETATGGQVRVEVGTEDGSALVSVTDECGGIPAEQIAHVFEPGVRVRESAERGAGLGLAIAAAFVEAHGGHIAVRNVGAGCRFDIRLPLATDAARPER